MIKIFNRLPTYWLYPLITYKESKNLSNGEVEKFTFDGADKKNIGYRLIEPCAMGYNYIWVHLGFGYYKCISKLNIKYTLNDIIEEERVVKVTKRNILIENILEING